jgi:hypothetical protein
VEREPLPVARDEVETGDEVVGELADGGRPSLEDQNRGHVHVRAVALEVQEACVEASQTVAIRHCPILPLGGTSRK